MYVQTGAKKNTIIQFEWSINFNPFCSNRVPQTSSLDWSWSGHLWGRRAPSGKEATQTLQRLLHLVIRRWGYTQSATWQKVHCHTVLHMVFEGPFTQCSLVWFRASSETVELPTSYDYGGTFQGGYNIRLIVSRKAFKAARSAYCAFQRQPTKSTAVQTARGQSAHGYFHFQQCKLSPPPQHKLFEHPYLHQHTHTHPHPHAYTGQCLP